jgi:hypothetical protein
MTNSLSPWGEGKGEGEEEKRRRKKGKGKCPLTFISPQRGEDKFLLPSGEKVRMRGK